MLVPMLASITTGYVLPPLTLDYGMGISTSVTACVCMFSSYISCLLCILNDRADFYDKELLARKDEIIAAWYKEDGYDQHQPTTVDNSENDRAIEEIGGLEAVSELGHLFWCVAFDTFLTYGMLFT